ncbi:MAG: RidA family protein [Oscillospiraceae bacterium]|nr:RidA family protein [Oscillospiraceae bacterium]
MAIRRFESNGRFSKVVEHNGILYISGQVCKDPNGDIKAQTASTLEKIEEILVKYGSDKEHMLSATVYLKDMALFKEMNSVYDAWVVKDNEPARACVEAKLASPSILVEIACIAAVKE